MDSKTTNSSKKKFTYLRISVTTSPGDAGQAVCRKRQLYRDQVMTDDPSVCHTTPLLPHLRHRITTTGCGMDLEF